ncbi:MAG TPA: hypothetical protein VD793_04435, partial [Gemmatimonadales bacterium]|nr:hypothetical protein [Gemmatimonadales bacterium]
HHHVGSPAGVFDAGSGGVRAALLAAAQEHGVTLRRGVEVVRILVRGGRASGVVLAGGEEVRASTVLSGVDPRRTFLQLLDHDLLTPDFRRAVENIRFHGSRALVSLVLSRPPAFATICVSPGLEFLERAHDQAKYGRVSSRPMLEARFAGSDSGGRYLVAAFLQYAPYRLQDGPWGGEDRRRLGVFAVEALTAAVPALAGTVVEHAVLAPPDLESMFGITEGHLHHGELALDQVLFMRPVPGWAQYRTPVPGLYLCGSGAHPGGGIAGAAGYNAARAVLKAQ